MKKKYDERMRANYKRYYDKNKHKRIVSGVIRKRRKNIEKAGREPSPFCEICGRLCKTYFDHDHVTGKFRGWLCTQCNTALGLLQDNPARIDALKDYVIRNYLRNVLENQNYKLILDKKGRVIDIKQPLNQ